MKRTKKKNITGEIIVKKMKYNIPKFDRMAGILNTVYSWGIAVASICITPDWYKNVTHVIIISFLFLIGVIGIAISFRNYYITEKFKSDYQYYSESKRVSTALLSAMKRTNFEKTCNVLQSTYGTVPNWHPTNYCKNVLVYDVHQHLRNICINLKELVVDLAPYEFNDDMITVDLAYSYPSDDRFKEIDSIKRLCENKKKCNFAIFHNSKNSSGASAPKGNNSDSKQWKIITSGDHTSSKVNLHMYLDNSNSFYSHLAGQGYVFCNDKNRLEKANHYIWTSKDNEYNRIGSAIGTIIELKNDNPETVFIKAYLTIGTYGRKLVEEGDPLDEERFEKLFRETVINSYKTLIESEFSQMFIRHGIKEHYIDPQTGKLEML